MSVAEGAHRDGVLAVSASTKLASDGAGKQKAHTNGEVSDETMQCITGLSNPLPRPVMDARGSHEFTGRPASS